MIHEQVLDILHNNSDVQSFIIWTALFYWTFIKVCWWKIFVKANVPGWKALIPFYNVYVLYSIVWRPSYLCFLAFVPYVGVVMHVIFGIKVAKSFYQKSGFAVLYILLPLVGTAILAFDEDICYAVSYILPIFDHS